MLVVLSDLHFVDGAASAENVPARACGLFLEHILDLAEHARARKVTLLFLGDIFDLLRTEAWFHPAPGGTLGGPPPGPGPDPFLLADRPWGSERITDACRDRAIAIAEAVVAKCKPQLDILSGRNPTLAGVGDAALQHRMSAKGTSYGGGPAQKGKTPLTVERLYVPGNHDRLARVVPSVMKLFLGALDAAPAVEQEDGRILAATGVVARHGHEVDRLNFDPAQLGRVLPVPSDYLRMPIGDPITTEIMARLPYEVRADLTRLGLPPAVVQDVYDHLQEIEDVRPLRSVVGWLTRVKSQARWRSTSHSGVILKSIQKVARTLLPRMLALSTSRKWVWRRIRRDVGIVAKLYAVTVLFRFLPLGAISRILGVLDRIGGLLQTRDPNVTAALGALGGEGERVVFGHTHDFAHVPLHVTGGGARVYLNSGTWRTRVHQAADRSGYLRAKDMTYLVFYEPDESAGGAHKGASYETWNGVMRKRA